jgi:Ca2+-binding EF-hand superfamily protein
MLLVFAAAHALFSWQVALRQVAKVMAADPACLQGLADAFAALDTEHSGRIPYSQVVALLKSGKWDLSEVEVSVSQNPKP